MRYKPVNPFSNSLAGRPVITPSLDAVEEATVFAAKIAEALGPEWFTGGNPELAAVRHPDGRTYFIEPFSRLKVRLVGYLPGRSCTEWPAYVVDRTACTRANGAGISEFFSDHCAALSRI